VLSVLRLLLLSLVLVPTIVAAHMGVQQLRGNFHEVIPGELYRSAQPGRQDIEHLSARFGIRTIINLRNEKRGNWYTQEAQAARDAGIEMIDFPMSSSDKLSVEQAQALAEIMKRAPKPLLIHCEHGANRTGLAAAIYVGGVAGKSEMLSEFQISPYYGHVPIKGVGRYQMYQSWDDYEETLGF
jgi:protein tyrosine/serine phosphatase